jgi:hypothetical protein
VGQSPKRRVFHTSLFAGADRRIIPRFPPPEVALVLGLVLAAGGKEAADIEAGARDAIAAATTETRFLSPWVADVPARPPSLPEVLGHIVGAPGELRTWKICALPCARRGDAAREGEGTIEGSGGREILLCRG